MMAWNLVITIAFIAEKSHETFENHETFGQEHIQGKPRLVCFKHFLSKVYIDTISSVIIMHLYHLVAVQRLSQVVAGFCVSFMIKISICCQMFVVFSTRSYKKHVFIQPIMFLKYENNHLIA